MSASIVSSSPGRPRLSVRADLHPLHDDPAVLDALDAPEPSHQHALVERLAHLEVVRRHVGPGPAVDDAGLLGAEALHGARDVDGRVAAAVDGDAPSDARALAPVLDAAQQGRGVEDARRVRGGDLDAVGEVRADGGEARVEAPVVHGSRCVLDPRSGLDLHAHPDDARDLGVEHLAREAVPRDAVAHHPAQVRRRLADRHGVPEAREVVRGREAARPAADDEDVLARRRRPAAGARHPSRMARSPRKRSTAWIETAASSLARLHAPSHGW